MEEQQHATDTPATAEARYPLHELLAMDAYEVLGVAPFVLTGAIAHAGLKAEAHVTMSQIQQAIAAFLKAPAQ